MAKRISFYITGDEESLRITELLNDLARRLRERIKISSTSYVGWVTTRLRLALESSFGGRDELEIEVNSVAQEYQEALKTRLGVREYPAAKLGDQICYGEGAAELAQTLASLLTQENPPAIERILYQLSTSIEELRRPKPEVPTPPEEIEIRASELTGEGPGLYGSLLERLKHLDRLLEEGKIDRERYEKLKKAYEELLKG